MLAQGGANGPTWQMALGRDELWLVPPDASVAYALSHREYDAHVTLVKGAGFLVNIRNVPRRGTVGLHGHLSNWEPLRAWLAKEGELHLRAALSRRTRFLLPVGLFLCVTSVPIGLSSKLDPFVLAGGAGCVVLALLARGRPRTILLLLDAFTWLFLLISNATAAVQTGSKLAIFLSVMMGFFGWVALKTWLLFREIMK
jgi:hypothetical protein